MTLEGAFSDWVRHLTAEKGLSAKTIEAYVADVKSFLGSARAHGDATARLTREAHDAWFSSLAPCAGSTTARRRSSLKSFLAYGEQEGWVRPPFTANLESWHFRSAVPDYLTEEEVRRLLGHAPAGATGIAARDTLLLRVMVFLGLRVGEVCALRVGDLDAAEGLLKVSGKGNRIRLMPLPAWFRDELAAWVRERRAELGPPGPAFFPSTLGKALTRQEVWRLVKERARGAGIRRRVHPHLLRHSFATQLLASGAGLRSVQELLGHVDVRTTERYTHVAPERLRQVVKACHPLQETQDAGTCKNPGNGAY